MDNPSYCGCHHTPLLEAYWLLDVVPEYILINLVVVVRKFNPKAFQPMSRHTRAVLLLLKYPKAGWRREEERW